MSNANWQMQISFETGLSLVCTVAWSIQQFDENQPVSTNRLSLTNYWQGPEIEVFRTVRLSEAVSPPWQSVICDQKEICCKSSIVGSFAEKFPPLDHLLKNSTVGSFGARRQKSKNGRSLNVRACNNRLLRMYGSDCLWNIFVPFYPRAPIFWCKQMF